MKFRELHPNIQLRIIVQFLSMLATTSIIPFLAIYFAKTIGETLTGIFYVVVILSGVIGGLIGGHLSDQIGRKKLMVVSELMVMLTYIGITMVNAPWLESPYATIALFIVNMFFSGIFIPAAQAMIIDVSSTENRKYIYAISYWATNVATALGGMIGAFLFADYKFYLFIFISTVTGLSFLTTLLFIKETHTPRRIQPHERKPVQKPSILHTYSRVFKDKVFLLYITASIFILSIELHLTNYIGVRLEKQMNVQTLFSFQDWEFAVDGIRMLGFLKTENTVLVALFAGAVTLIIKRYHDRLNFNLGASLFVGGFTVASFSLNPWVLLLAIGLASFGELMYIPIKQSSLANLAPDNARSSYMAIDGFTYYFASIIGALFITLSTFVSPVMMSLIIFTSGLAGMYFFNKVITQVQLKTNTSSQEKAV
ncbi:MFS transporter [Pseudalkalibacillus sp. SCS-8]|uniref:MFS transporter n=1 Tax=Pseudalkalibacillus nanhaiensis TaxID=3115291 RepID=UPI0032D9B1BF